MEDDTGLRFWTRWRIPLRQVSLRARTGDDGRLTFEIPTEFKNAELLVTIAIIPAHGEDRSEKELEWPDGFFEET